MNDKRKDYVQCDCGIILESLDSYHPCILRTKPSAPALLKYNPYCDCGICQFCNGREDKYGNPTNVDSMLERTDRFVDDNWNEIQSAQFPDYVWKRVMVDFAKSEIIRHYEEQEELVGRPKVKSEHLRTLFTECFEIQEDDKRGSVPDGWPLETVEVKRLREMYRIVGDIIIWIEDFEKQQEKLKICSYRGETK